jgi:hypothetical protein
MKYLATILFLALCSIGQAQKTVPTTDETLAIPKLTFDPNWRIKNHRITDVIAKGLRFSGREMENA